VCTPLATKTPFTSRRNHSKACRIALSISARTKKTSNTVGTSHIHFEGLDDIYISPSPAVAVLASSRTAPLSGIECLRAQFWISCNLETQCPRELQATHSRSATPRGPGHTYDTQDSVIIPYRAITLAGDTSCLGGPSSNSCSVLADQTLALTSVLRKPPQRARGEAAC
jgi:hypothetical protein